MSRVNQPAVTDKCDICGQVIGGKNERGLKQGMGVHKRTAHGIKSLKYVPAEKRQEVAADNKASIAKALQARWSGHTRQTPEEVRAKARERYAKQKAERLAHLYREKPAQNGSVEPPSTNAIPCKLSECPCCGTRFYMVKGNS